MRVHFIQNGVVINTVEQDTLDNPFGYLAVASETAEIGDLWDGVTFTRPVVAVSVQELQAAIVNAVQVRLDAFAQTRNYDGILSAATYASSTVPKFAAEGQCAVNARDNTWATLYTVMAEVEAGTRPMPGSYADVEPLLPALVWPA